MTQEPSEPQKNSGAQTLRRRRQGVLLLGVLGGVGVALIPLAPNVLGAREAVSPVRSTQYVADTFRVTLGPDTTREVSRDLKNLAPGDRVEHHFALVNTSRIPVGRLEVSQRFSGALASLDEPLNLKGCLEPFDGAGRCADEVTLAAPGAEGQTTAVTIPPRGTLYLKATFNLPLDLSNETKNAEGAVKYAFTAYQADVTSIPQPESR